ncbi:MAG: PrsW family glutamic-type intramembrane protease, partial [Chloroflexota bacterium]
MKIVALLIATLIPLAILYFINTRNLYKTDSFGVIMVSFFWGVFAFGLASLLNRFLIANEIVSRINIIQFVAPVEEEIFKAFIFILLFRKINFTYFVDGAVYGFAIGIGFAIVENYEYISNLNAEAALTLAISRVISTNLIHAAASSIVGMAFGRARFA